MSSAPDHCEQTVFFCLYHDYREFEWFKPYITAFKERRNVTVLLPVAPGTPRQLWVLNEIRKLDVCIGLMDSISWTGRQSSTAKISGRAERVIRRLFHPEGFLIRNSRISRSFFQQNWMRALSNCNLAVFTDGRMQTSERWRLNGLVQHALRTCRTPVVTLPFAALSMLRGDRSAASLKLYGVSQGGFYCLRRQVCSGPARFATAGGGASELDAKPDTNTVVFALKNRTSYIPKILDAERHEQLRINIIKEILRRDFDVVLKPHPGIPHDEVEELVQKFKGNGVSTSYNSLADVCQRADAAVFEFPSSGMFEVLLSEIPVYWPIDQLAKAANFDTTVALQRFLQNEGIAQPYFHIARIGLPLHGSRPLAQEDIAKIRQSLLGRNHEEIVPASTALQDLGVL